MEQKEKKCTWCRERATRQTVKGEQNQKSGGLPQNDGWYCNSCWEKGGNVIRRPLISLSSKSI